MGFTFPFRLCSHGFTVLDALFWHNSAWSFVLPTWSGLNVGIPESPISSKSWVSRKISFRSLLSLDYSGFLGKVQLNSWVTRLVTLPTQFPLYRSYLWIRYPVYPNVLILFPELWLIRDYLYVLFSTFITRSYYVIHIVPS